MSLRQVLAVGVLALVQVGHGVKPHTVDAHLKPVFEQRKDRFLDGGVVEIEVGLVRVKTMPVVGLGHRVPAPVGGLEILEDDPCVLVLLRVVAPDVKVALRAAGRRVPRALKPGMVVGGVIDDQLGDHPDAVIVGCFEKLLEVVERAVMGMNARVVGDVVAVVFQRRRIKGQEPERRDPKVLQVWQLLGQASEVADAVARAVGEGPNVGLVNNGVLVPERVNGGHGEIPGSSRKIAVPRHPPQSARVVRMRAIMKSWAVRAQPPNRRKPDTRNSNGIEGAVRATAQRGKFALEHGYRLADQGDSITFQANFDHAAAV